MEGYCACDYYIDNIIDNMVDKKLQGKKNRRSGAVFELKVRKDLENKGWTVAKWTNNVEFEEFALMIKGKLIPAKRKFNPFMKALSIGVGFPDFICFRISDNSGIHKYYEVIAVESKSNGYLDKEEKEKCKWLLDNHIFSKILIAKKGEGIIYTEWKDI